MDEDQFFKQRHAKVGNNLAVAAVSPPWLRWTF